MDDVWLSVIEDGTSSQSSCYSDEIASDVEAELYSLIHHEGNLSDKKNSENEYSYRESITNTDCNPVKKESCMTSNLEESKYNPSFALEPQKSNQNCSTEILLKNSVQNLNSPRVQNSYCNQKKINTVILTKDSKPQKLKKLPKILPKNEIRTDLIKKEDSLQQNNTVLVDSSDSDDSIILIEENKTGSTDLLTNLLKDSQTISSLDSNSDTTSTPDNVAFQDIKEEPSSSSLSFSNIRNGEDVWYIDEEDRYRSKKRRKRYHTHSEITCSNCNEKGHVAKSCPMPKIIKCFVCGGAHAGSHCENRICGKCYNFGHNSRFCRMQFAPYCDLCNMRGHVRQYCPDLWRRYHLSTDPFRIVPAKRINQDKAIYCFNCGFPGHFGSVCNEPRGPSDSYLTWPSVVSYKIQNEAPTRRKNLQTASNSIDVQNSKIKRSSQYPQDSKRIPVLIRNIINERRNKQKRFKSWENETRDSSFMAKNIAQKEKDFPRTPRKAVLEKSYDNLPESVELELKDQFRRKKRNEKRNQRRRQKMRENS